MFWPSLVQNLFFKPMIPLKDFFYALEDYELLASPFLDFRSLWSLFDMPAD